MFVKTGVGEGTGVGVGVAEGVGTGVAAGVGEGVAAGIPVDAIAPEEPEPPHPIKSNRMKKSARMHAEEN